MAERTRLFNVRFLDNSRIKRLGGQWDDSLRCWTVPSNLPIDLIQQWLPKQQLEPGKIRDTFKVQPKASSPDSPAYLSFKKRWRHFQDHLPTLKYRDHVGSFVRVGAIMMPKILDYEGAAERYAIEHESDPL
jgi:hypothetical protein